MRTTRSPVRSYGGFPNERSVLGVQVSCIPMGRMGISNEMNESREDLICREVPQQCGRISCQMCSRRANRSGQSSSLAWGLFRFRR